MLVRLALPHSTHVFIGRAFPSHEHLRLHLASFCDSCDPSSRHANPQYFRRIQPSPNLDELT
ncbi:hypothetical protein PanWU01x14_340730 [Parasponia andersonii]|uniref:Uncharacterized protein n=1 Tax=Parasponia andersonii TaxID=3476 RepID=A0A2P5AEC4_PARAD|nr:hypothetical protein PanWU01x14_340730 [Parasponia andersonii]